MAITELPSDTMRLILEKLDSPKGIAALLGASKSFQQSTMAALPPQQRLWYGTRLGQLQHVESALKEGARVNKLDPTGRNALLLLRDAMRRRGADRLYYRRRYRQVEEFLISKGAKAFNQDSLNKALCDIVGNSGPPSDTLLRVKEAILLGADIFNARLQYGQYLGIQDGTYDPMDPMDIMQFAIYKAKLEPSVYIPWIKTLLECGFNTYTTPTRSLVLYMIEAIDFLRPDLDNLKLWAAICGQPSEVVGSRTEILKVLLNAPNADVNELTRDDYEPEQISHGFTALHYLQLGKRVLLKSFPMDDGLRQENIAIARLLLQAGADVSIRAEDSAVDMAGTAVDMAECNLHGFSFPEYEIWTEYFQAMLNVLKAAEEARDGFIRAVEVNDVDSVQQHIARGAPVNTMFEVRDLPTTPLHLAILNCYVIYGGPGVLKALLAAPNINVNVQGHFIHGERRGTPLHYAVEINEVECVRALLAVPGVDVNAKTDDDDLNNKFAGLQETPLHMAAEDSKVDIIHLLLSAPNINVNERSHDKITALHNAAFNGELEAVKALLSAPNIDVNSRDWEGITPLHLAVEEKHDDVMMALLSAPNIDVNVRSDKGETALQLALAHRHVEAVMALLSSPNLDIDSEPPHIRDAVKKTVEVVGFQDFSVFFCK